MTEVIAETYRLRIFPDEFLAVLAVFEFVRRIDGSPEIRGPDREIRGPDRNAHGR